jgi:ABC-type phosphate/phosphonate transport system substrate-binding protein
VIPVANARMYSVARAAAAGWRSLLAHVAAEAGIEMAVLDHPPPAGLPELWARPDLGAVFMCGWPFALEGGIRPIIAAPVPAARWSEGKPIYRAEFVVSAGSPYRTIDDVLGRRFAYNAEHSHSGWNMPFAHLAALGAPPFAACVGPFVTHQRSIRAVAEGEADVASVDSYVLDLLRLHDPALAAAVRVVEATTASPIPPLVGGALEPGAEQRLRTALLGLHESVPGLLAPLALRRFVAVSASDYTRTLQPGADQAA